MVRCAGSKRAMRAICGGPPARGRLFFNQPCPTVGPLKRLSPGTPKCGVLFEFLGHVSRSGKMASIKVSAFRWVPPALQGLIRDLRVRWALEEAGMAYEEKLIGFGSDLSSKSYRALQPFGQI